MIYAVIDTNVIVSAYITKNLSAATSQVWAAVLQGKIIPAYSDEMIDEYTEMLHRKKFDIPEHLIKWAIDRVLMNGILGDRVPSAEHFPDPKDVVFYEFLFLSKYLLKLPSQEDMERGIPLKWIPAWNVCPFMLKC